MSCALGVTTSKVFSPQHLLQVLSRLPNTSRYWVAYSGGLDSHVLLHAVAALRIHLPTVAVHAAHVHHGLQAQAEQWAKHCEHVCQSLHVPFHLLRINAHAAPGESPEAAARDARYTALGGLIELGDCLLTAHHQDDQAETLLIQLLRGAGPQGLASMPVQTGFAKGLHARPLLEFTRDELHAYGEQHELHWIDDHSNLNTDFDRNYLRHDILPRLRERWPAAARTLSRSASHAAEAAHLLEALAHTDLHYVRGPQADMLSISKLLTLDTARQKNVLRYWIKSLGLPLPSTTHVEHILSDAITANWDSTPCVRWPGAELRRYRDLIYAMTPLPAHEATQQIVWDMTEVLRLPNNLGNLSALAVTGAGLKASLCRSKSATIRFRQGGERCQPVGRDGSHELKNLLQEQGIPPWLRDRIPLIYLDNSLAAVADRWVCQPFQAHADEPGVQISLLL